MFGRFIMAIKNILNKIKPYIPPIIEIVVKKNIRHTLSGYIKSNLKKNLRFKDLHAGERCFILATGPSILKQDLIKLKDEICFSVGQFYLHPDCKIIKPSYHVEAPIHEPFDFEYHKKFFPEVTKSLSEDVEIFLGISKYKYSFEKYLNQNNLDAFQKNINYINYSGTMQLDEGNCNNSDTWDITKTPFLPRTVVYTAIQIAVFMGFSEIYLLGCDHDYLKLYFNSSLDEHHFYKQKDSLLHSTGHEDLAGIKLEQWFREYYYRWKQYRIMSECLASSGQRIFNATEGGILDVFPRINFENLVNVRK